MAPPFMNANGIQPERFTQDFLKQNSDSLQTKRFYALGQSSQPLLILDLALPDDENRPAHSSQGSDVALVAVAISLTLNAPNSSP